MSRAIEQQHEHHLQHLNNATSTMANNTMNEKHNEQCQCKTMSNLYSRIYQKHYTHTNIDFDQYLCIGYIYNFVA